MSDCFGQAVRACHPENCLDQHLPAPPANGKIILLAGGKAAGAMMKVAARHYLRRVDKQRICGVAVGKPDGFAPMFHMTWIGAGHPVPDENSVKGAQLGLLRAHEANRDDLVVVLLSGGASALWCAPIKGVSLADKQGLTLALLHSGAPIDEINIVRRQLSAIKGGRLAQAAYPARLLTLAISDVVGDHQAIIGSGVSVGGRDCLNDARFALARHNLHVEPHIVAALNEPKNQSLRHDDERLAAATWRCIANGARALEAAQSVLREAGYRVINLGDKIEGEARQVAKAHAELIEQHRNSGENIAILSGGELTVTVKGKGSGGPNQEYALALAIAMDGAKDIYALAADTDGCDGGTGAPGDPAGAMIFPSTLQRARAQKLNPATFLADNNSGVFFKRLYDSLMTKARDTNVNDFRLVLIENR